MNRKLFYILVFISTIYNTIGQVDSSSRIRNIFLGLDLSPQLLTSPNINILPTISSSLTCSINQKHFFKLKYIKTLQTGLTDFDPTKDKALPSRLTALNSFSLQYGTRLFATKKIMGILYFGISKNNGVYRQNVSKMEDIPASSGGFLFGPSPAYTEYNYNYSIFKNIGLPINANFSLPNYHSISSGFELYGNINKYSFFGLGLYLGIGHTFNIRK